MAFLSFIGDFFNDISGTSSNNNFNASEAQKQRDFEKMMSDTSYQRAVEDMEKAGLNPAMLYQSGGNGAGTPSGASADATSGRAMELIGQTANLVNSITNARKVDSITNSNEISKQAAQNSYEGASDMIVELAQLLAKG